MNDLVSKQICCLIITYNPDGVLYELISVIKNQVDKIVIVDNNSDLEVQGRLREIAKQLDIYLIMNSENLGIAKALNQGVVFAKTSGYAWVLAFDQDSKPLKNLVEILAEVYEAYPNKWKIGAIGVNFINSTSTNYYQMPLHKVYVERDYLITSGCLLFVDAYSEIGGFREDYFIDNVDIEYSLRLRKNNKVLLITRKPGMLHSAGNPIRKRFWGIIGVGSTNHNCNRRYYMAKNHIILSKEYLFKFPYFISKLNFFFVLSIIQLLLLEANKKDKIIRTFKGIVDGFKN